MKPKRESLIRAISIKLLEDPSGRAAVKALNKAIDLNMTTEWEADEIFYQAEREAYPAITERTPNSGRVLPVGIYEREQRPKIQKYSSYAQRR